MQKRQLSDAQAYDERLSTIVENFLTEQKGAHARLSEQLNKLTALAQKKREEYGDAEREG